MNRALWIIAAALVALCFYIEPCDGHSCKRPALEVTR